MPINGTSNGETINGTSGADEIFGLGGNDTINGLEGNDIIYGGTGNDIMNGGDGDDLFVEDEFTGSQDQFNGGAGTDTIELRVISNPIITQSGSLSPHTMTGPSSLTSIERMVFASTSGNVVQGTILYGAPAASGLVEVVAGAGRDFFAYTTGTAAGTFTMPTLTYTGFTPVATNAWEATAGDLVVLVSNAAAGTAVTLNAAAGLNVQQLLLGGAGNDTLNGSDNADFLNGGGGTNTLNGGGGNDSLGIVNQYAATGTGFVPPTTFNGSGSTLNGGTGTDVLSIGGFVDLQATLVSIEGVQLQPAFVPPLPNTAKQDAAFLVLDAAHIAMLPSTAFFTGTGSVQFNPGDAASLNLSTFVLNPGNAVEFLLYAGDGNGLTFTGSANGDLLELGIGTQTALGGGGDDRIVFGAGTQTATGGGGADRFGIGIGSGVVTDFVIGEDKIDFSDTGITNAGRLGDLNFVQNGAHLTISADSGGDHYEIVLQNTLLANFSVSDVIFDTGGFATIETGTQFADFLFGHGLNDNLAGGDGNDRLYGGGGVDILDGGNGDDVIIIDGVPQFGGSYLGGAGTDTLLIRYNGPNTFNGIFGTVSGIERLAFDGEAGQAISAGVLFPTVAGGLTNVIGGDASDTFVAVATAGGSYNLNALTLTNWNTAQPAATGGDTLVQFATETLAADVTFTARSDIGNQALIGALGNDTLTGAGFGDFLRGNGGNDVIQGNGGDDTLLGDAGDDTLAGGAGADIINGGAGNDLATYQFSDLGGPIAIDMQAVTTSTTAQQVNDGRGSFDSVSNIERLSLGGTAAGDTLLGSLTIANQLFGLGGTDTLVGGAAADTIDGGDGADQMIGGAGNDNYVASTQADLVFELADGGTDTVLAATSFYLYANIENLTLTAGVGDIFGVGNALNNTLIGNEGANLLLAGAGNDSASGGDGNDVLYGEDGVDTLHGDAGVDYLIAGTGNDLLYGDAGSDALYGEDGDDLLDGGNSADTDILIGGAGNDTLDGDSDQAIAEYDLLYGEGGNDSYRVDSFADLTFEAADGGTDTVYADLAAANSGVYLYANVENLVLEGITFYGVGNDLNNQLTGSASANWLLGGAGNDRITGGAGNDVLFGQAGADTFVFGAGSGGDTIADFALAEDKIEFSSYFTSFAQVEAASIQNGANMAINMGGGNFIVLLGVNKANLTAANFTFVAGAEASMKGAFAESGFDDWALAQHMQALV